MNKKHYEVVAAVIEKDGLIFCSKRGPKGECAYKWEFPGGKIEQGETKEEALKREIKEELDGEIIVEKYITTVNHEYDTFSITMHVYKCSLLDHLVLKEHIDYKWVKKEELMNIDFAEADKKVLFSNLNKYR